MVEYYHEKYKQIYLKKNIKKKNNLINLKTWSSEFRAKRTNKKI